MKCSYCSDYEGAPGVDTLSRKLFSEVRQSKFLLLGITRNKCDFYSLKTTLTRKQSNEQSMDTFTINARQLVLGKTFRS